MTSKFSSFLIFAKKIFFNQFIFKNRIIIFMIQSYNYITFIKKRFDNQEFRKILIDTNAIFVSIVELKQFIALRRIRKIELRKTNFQSSDIIFDVENSSIINRVALNTFLKRIVFYIVKIDILFSLFLANINKFKTYFNNVVNKIVQLTQTYFVIRKYEYVFLREVYSRIFSLFILSQFFHYLNVNKLCRFYRCM